MAHGSSTKQSDRAYNASMSISINFSDPDFIRKSQSQAADIDLLKAVGLAKRRGLSILDTCAGRGQDAALMAIFSGHVLALERNLIIFEALETAVNKLSIRKPWKDRLQIMHQDAIFYLQALQPTHYPDVIYIDPMYPCTHKNPRNNQQLREIRELAGADEDAHVLLEHAFGKALERIVVKRPKRAPFLGSKEPSYQCKGNSTRYDIYLASLWGSSSKT
jgi:16S rRNA (guanine1516-N2)-methyltransferase